jgi:hypothetical protein
MAERCRLCTANDRDGVIEQLAADLWNSRRHGTLDDHPWEQAGDYWQRMFRELAVTAVGSLAHDEHPR